MALPSPAKGLAVVRISRNIPYIFPILTGETNLQYIFQYLESRGPILVTHHPYRIPGRSHGNPQPPTRHTDACDPGSRRSAAASASSNPDAHATAHRCGPLLRHSYSRERLLNCSCSESSM